MFIVFYGVRTNFCEESCFQIIGENGIEAGSAEVNNAFYSFKADNPTKRDKVTCGFFHGSLKYLSLS